MATPTKTPDPVPQQDIKLHVLFAGSLIFFGWLGGSFIHEVRQSRELQLEKERLELKHDAYREGVKDVR